MEPAAAILAAVDPALVAPTSVRSVGRGPDVKSSTDGSLVDHSIEAVVALLEELDEGTVAVVSPRRLFSELLARARDLGESRVSVLSARGVKGLEFDATVVVEPAELVDEEAEGLRSLYVALTRATQRLVVVHDRPLPDALAGAMGEPARRGR
jgi:DNA helicase IV